ncbi:MAG: hypothetical protein EBY41_00425 [Proteobacteria bacterium]|nr:hypothetical protein [Pseudomonadota bacterium]
MRLMTVEEIIDEIIRREGGYVNHKNDRGGPTNMGVTQKTLSNFLGREVSIEEVKNLSKEMAEEIYSRNYYEKPGIAKLPKEIQPIMLDACVLYGPRRAIRFLQTVINEAGFGPTAVDGISGPGTRKLAEKANESMGGFLINAIVEERIEFCERIVENNPSQSVFLKGWTNRANEFRVEV